MTSDSIERARARIQNLRDDLHYQISSELVKNHDIIVLPESDFNSAIKKAGRKIRNKSVRSLMTFSFATFRNRVVSKANQLGKSVKLVCESFTSKTHNITGEVKYNLGGSKVIESKGIKIDRDINGALGILLKALLKTGSPYKHSLVCNRYQLMLGNINEKRTGGCKK